MTNGQIAQSDSNKAEDALLYTPSEGARMLRVSRSRFWEEMRAGRIAYVKIGSRRYILPDELRRYVASLRHGAI